MKLFINLFALATLLFITSCEPFDPNKQIDEGKVEGQIYTSQEVGWTMRIPDGWKVMSKEKRIENDQKGMDAIKEIAGEFDYSGLKLIVTRGLKLIRSHQRQQLME